MLILGISYDALANDSELQRYASNRGLGFPLTTYERSIVVDGFRITSQSSAIGIDTDGIIQLRKGYGGWNRSQWQAGVDSLTGN